MKLYKCNSYTEYEANIYVGLVKVHTHCFSLYWIFVLSFLRIFLNNVPLIPAQIFSLVDHGSFQILSSSAFQVRLWTCKFCSFCHSHLEEENKMTKKGTIAW